MSAISKIENQYLQAGNITYPKSRETIASEWKVTFGDGRVILYTVTIMRGSLKNDYLQSYLYIQIDDCSTLKDRHIFIYSKKKKLSLNKKSTTTTKEYYKIAEKPFDDFKNEEDLSFDKINKKKWLQALDPCLKGHIKTAVESEFETVPLLANRRSEKHLSFSNDSRVYSVNDHKRFTKSKFLKIFFPCCFK